MYYKMFLLLLLNMMTALAQRRAGNVVDECDLTRVYDYGSDNCNVFSVKPPDINRVCWANIWLNSNIPLYLEFVQTFSYMEIAITTRPSIQPERIKIEKFMFGNEHEWHHIELQEIFDVNGYTYSVYINDNIKKEITSSNEATKIEVYFKGYLYYALGCNPVPNVPLSKPIQTTTTTTTPQPTSQPISEHWTTSVPSLPTPTNGTIDADSKEYQPDQEGFSPVFIISVSAGVAGVVLLIIIAIHNHVLRKKLKSGKGDKAQSPLENETEIISFHNNPQRLSPQDDPMEDDPEKHIYWEVTDLGLVARVGVPCYDDRP
ncbi:hypothetical protein Pcinc_043077 [Petrolisthes cinctipes]|uniref:Uncharacterized protein n=2 Tax=Petrolisthes cinctipes TaxID=88211 RepID=A0AAE1EGE6_PETCI|nr:hypothetical protein Pcinc_043077 [Petrolisthes cinctipes]